MVKWLSVVNAMVLSLKYIIFTATKRHEFELQMLIAHNLGCQQ